MLIKALRTIITSSLFFFGLLSQSNALVVYNNLGSNDSYNPNIGWGFGPSSTVHMQFSLTGSGYFSQLTIAVGNMFDSSMTVELRADNGNVGPGAILETLSFMVLDRAVDYGGLQVVSAAGTTLLSDQTWYWLTVKSTSNYVWFFNNTGAAGYMIGNFGNPSVQTLGAFKIEVADSTPVPEPALGGLVVLAPLMAAAVTRRRLSA